MTITGASILADPPVGGHIVFPYSDEVRAMDVVANYAAAGFRNGEAVVLILTPEHCTEIDDRLSSEGFDILALKGSAQYQCADAAKTLSKFMAAEIPDQNLFEATVRPIIKNAKAFGKVRAYGEMVSLLFRKNHAAALRLEEFWNDLLRTESICLLCTYNITGSSDLASDLCATHSHYVV
ncbi:MAG: MEDS domain-containing protein [Fimbriimonas sp.]